MTTRAPKEIGYVVPLSGITRGFTVCVTRYPSGRLLPAPRTILDTSGDKPRPFASVLAALDALALWKAGPRAVKPLRPTDSVDLAAPESLADESREAFRDGFVGKLAIHPRQIAPINEAFQASAAQLDWARRVLAAFAAHPHAGAFNLDGQMIDQPHLRLARRLCGEG